MPLIIPSNSISAGGYVVDNSLRFNDGSSDYLNRSLSSTSTSWTFSAWVKRGSNLGATNYIISWGNSGTDATGIGFNASNTFQYYSESSPDNKHRQTSAVYRDTSAWYHLVVKSNSNAITLYVNGEEPTQSWTTGSSANPLDTSTMQIGKWVTSAYYHDGYMSEVVFIDGTALDPTSFGEFDEDSEIWKPIDVSGLTFGTNGFYLDFENSGSLGADVSGNGNNFTVNNLTAIDQTTDTPTNNFATGNPLDYSGTAPTLGNGNLSITSAELSDKPFRTTIAVSQGKWYMEYKCEKSGSDNDNHIGLWSAENSLTSNYVGYQLYSWGIFTGNGNKRNNQSYDSYGSAIAQNDIVMIALDKDNGKIWWGKNGTWFASGNPATGSNEAFSNINTVVGSNGFVSFCFLPQQKFSLNFGSPPFTISSGNTDANGYGNFEYAVPSGYLSLCTKNLSEVLG